MTVLFQRRCTLVLPQNAGGQILGLNESLHVEIKHLRMQFKIVKTTDKTPNTAEIQVWNLKEETRSRLQTKAAGIILLAGYEGSEAQIFAGEARTIDGSLREGPNTVTKVQCGDGETAYQHARVNESWSPGTPITTAVKAALAALKKRGVDTASAEAAVAGIADQAVNGGIARGTAIAELDRLLLPRGFEYSIQDGRLQILAAGELAKGEEVLLSKDTGMLGSPQYGTPDKKGGPSLLQVKSLLNPKIKCGGKVLVRSKTLRGGEGSFRVQKLGHEGDTAGNSWWTMIEAVAA